MKDTYINEIFLQGTSLAVIAMCWAHRHPDKAENLFTNPAAEAMYPELGESISGPAAYSGWLNMAKMMVLEYSEEEGFPKYDDLA